MKQNPSKKQGHCLSPAEIEERLKAANIMPTLQRISLCRYVLCEAEHVTADQVVQWAQKNLAKVSRATVYNTLATLVQAGLLRELRFAHSDKVIYDNNVTDHHHFLDEDSGDIYDIEANEVEVSPRLQKGFQIKSVQVLLRGVKS